MEQQSVNQRLQILVDAFEKGTKAAFARKIGISPQGAQELLNGRKGDPSFKVLIKILESYPQIRMEWLLFGNGSMLNKRADADSEQVFESQGSATALQLSQELEAISKKLADATNIMSNLKEQYQGLSGDASHIAGLQVQEVISDKDQLFINEHEAIKNTILERAKPLRAEINDLTNKLSEKRSQYASAIANLSNSSQDVLSSIYRIEGAPDFTRPHNGLLTKRLDISEETAQQLISEGRIRSVQVGDEGHRVTELAVREFLGESSLNA